VNQVAMMIEAMTADTAGKDREFTIAEETNTTVAQEPSRAAQPLNLSKLQRCKKCETRGEADRGVDHKKKTLKR